MPITMWIVFGLVSVIWLLAFLMVLGMCRAAGNADRDMGLK